MDRPSDLPEFDNPPLDEVVFSLQFEPCVGYSQILAFEVWQLFRDEFPGYAEQPPIPPVFEMFGDTSPSGGFNFNITAGPMHPRYWFLNKAGDQLLQFQPDRFLHNWRKVGDRTNAYPRFESMIIKYRAQLAKLFAYFDGLMPESMAGYRQALNQVEVSYINIIPMPNQPGMPELSKWVRLLSQTSLTSDAASISFNRALRRDDKLIGRLHGQIGSAKHATGADVIRIELTVRGIPPGQSLDDAIDFLRFGRDIIVRTFAEITTDSAHQIWKRLK